ncbi:MAG: NAD(P)/FAD-dependent oxidoreductase [Solirubrobacteraceae bacterium]
MADVDVLLIGGGVASAACATQLREEGFGGSILLAGRESDAPYNRPPVSKGYLLGEEDREAALVHPGDWWAENDVDLRTRVSVMKLDTEAKLATLSTKDEITYDKALLATGANVRRLPVDGSDLEGIHYLRALRNADVLRDDVADAERVVLIGGSYIGTEVAASLTKLGKRCAIVMQEDVVLSGLGPQAGRFFQGVLEAHGVEIHGGEVVARFEGTGERVERVICESGLELECGAVVLGVGAVPDVMLARAAGLDIGHTGGVKCDTGLRTSAPDLWAAGDVCEYDSGLHEDWVRFEHWGVAIEQGKHVARAMQGAERPYEVVPYFFSDLADWASMEYVGGAQRWDTTVVRGSIDSADFSLLYLDHGRVVASLAVGRSDDIDRARRMIAGRQFLSGDLTGL